MKELMCHECKEKNNLYHIVGTKEDVIYYHPFSLVSEEDLCWKDSPENVLCENCLVTLQVKEDVKTQRIGDK